MAELQDYLRTNEGEQYPEADRKTRRSYPTGWETPRVSGSESEADAVSDVYERTADEVELLRGWDMDPDDWEIVEGTLYTNRWQTGSGEWCYQYKAKLRRRSSPRMDVEELLAGIGRYKPPKAAKTVSETALLITPSDWQIGKGDGDGVEGTVRRIQDSTARLVAHARKVKPSAIYVVGLGDLLEQVCGNYPAQPFTVQLDHRQQMRVTRRLLRDLVVALSRLGIPMVVSGVAGNHGEYRQGGKAITGPGDNDDVAVVEQVAEVLQANPEAFGHVNFHIPDDRLHLVLDIYGHPVGFHHGHVAGRGSTPQQKQANFWKEHAFMESALGECRFFFSGHYHHLSVVDYGPKVHFQAPAMDGGSGWWENRGGGRSAAGTLSVTIGPDGWDNLKVL
jgi:hypothetical protein